MQREPKAGASHDRASHVTALVTPKTGTYMTRPLITSWLMHPAATTCGISLFHLMRSRWERNCCPSGIRLAIAPKSAWFHLLSASAIGNNNANGVKGSEPSGESWEWGEKKNYASCSCLRQLVILCRNTLPIHMPAQIPPSWAGWFCAETTLQDVIIRRPSLPDTVQAPRAGVEQNHHHWRLCLCDWQHAWVALISYLCSIGASMSSTKIPCG